MCLIFADVMNQKLLKFCLYTLAVCQLHRHTVLLKKLHPVHMSSDETEGPTVKTHLPRFQIVDVCWQSL